MLPLALVLAAVWGAIWALFIQFHPLGHFLAIKRTWLTVVIGVGMDLLLLFLLIDWLLWLQVAAVIACSSVPIIGRSLWNEWNENREVLDGIKNTPRQ